MSKKNFGRNEVCPCGSGKKYKYCCINKDFKWVINDNGSIAKELTISDPELIEGLEKKYNDFKETFGREPLPDEPLFYQEYLLGSEIESREHIIEAMEFARVDPALIYAFKKTGRIVTELNKSKLTDMEYEEWRNAGNEYYKTLDDNKEELEIGVITEKVETLKKEYQNCIIIFAMIIDKCGKISHSEEQLELYSFNEYIFYCITRTLKTLRSIDSQLEQNFVEDSYNLVRSIYENFLYIIYALKNPDQLKRLIIARIGTSIGTHEYLQKNGGGVDKKKIINKSTGEIIDWQISKYRMAQSSEFEEDTKIFNFLYDFLSQYTHPDIISIQNYMGNNKFDHKKKESPDLAYIFTLFLCSLILNSILRIDLDEQVKKDTIYFLNKLRSKLFDVFSVIPNTDKNSVFPMLFKRRVEYLINQN